MTELTEKIILKKEYVIKKGVNKRELKEEKERYYQEGQAGGEDGYWGLAYELYETGELKWYGFYEFGIKNGEYAKFHENGELEVFCFYAKGMIIGSYREWDEDGKKRVQKEYNVINRREENPCNDVETDGTDELTLSADYLKKYGIPRYDLDMDGYTGRLYLSEEDDIMFSGMTYAAAGSRVAWYAYYVDGFRWGESVNFDFANNFIEHVCFVSERGPYGTTRKWFKNMWKEIGEWYYGVAYSYQKWLLSGKISEFSKEDVMHEESVLIGIKNEKKYSKYNKK